MLKLHLDGKYTEIDTVVTHNGRFHADEVYAIAVLQVAATIESCNGVFDFNGEYDGVKVERVSDPSSCSQKAFLIDIGGGRYDHHQVEEDPLHWEDGTLKASVGRIYTDVRSIFEHACGARCAETILEEIVKPIDHNDTTGHPFVLASMVDAYNNDDVSNDGRQDSRFIAVLEKATEHVWAVACAGHERTLRMADISRTTMQVNYPCGEVIICSKRAIAEEVSEFYPNAVACVYPHERGSYVIRSLPTTMHEPWKAPFKFRGLRDTEELRVWKATFCHKAGFIMGFETMNDAAIFLSATFD